MRVTVIGTGYLGVTHAACLAAQGCEVLGLDVDADRVQILASGRTPFHEPGLAELVAENVAAGRLRFTTSWARVGAFADVHFLCVSTPQRPDGPEADLSHLEAATDALAPHLRDGCLVVGKSTVPVGTGRQLSMRLAARSPAGVHPEVAWNPEFLSEGRAVADSLRPDRIVVGVGSSAAERLLRAVYAAPLGGGVPLVVTDVPTAELVKEAANAFLATKVSFMNAMAELCEAAGADVVALREALGHDDRIGRRYLHAGVGFGGGCLPKDIRALRAQAVKLGAAGTPALLRDVEEINLESRRRVVDLATAACGGVLTGQRVTVLGASFKPDSDDVRDSPALAVAATLRAGGAAVTVYDPVAEPNAARVFPNLSYSPSPVEAAVGAHVVLHLTEWPEFRTLDPGVLAEVVAHRYIIDGRNALDPERWRRAGWTYRGMGRP